VKQKLPLLHGAAEEPLVPQFEEQLVVQDIEVGEEFIEDEEDDLP